MSTFWKIKRLGQAFGTLRTLIMVTFTLLTWCSLALSAELRDVRVGEYKGFTRIVFELTEPVIKPAISIQSANQLHVTFNNTNANLIRRIPVGRSPHVEEIQFWQRKEDLSTLLMFNYPHIRMESFRLSRPPRFAVDVFPVTQPVTGQTTQGAVPKRPDAIEAAKKRPTEISEKAPQKKADEAAPKSEDVATPPPPETVKPPVTAAISEQPLDKGDAPGSAPEQTVSSPSASERPNTAAQNEEATFPSGSTSQSLNDNKITQPDMQAPSMLPTARDDSSKMSDNSLPPRISETPVEKPINEIEQEIAENAKNATQPSNRLQFYLVIILVIITIAILLLLLLMLLTRHQLFYDKDVFSAAEISQHQDKNIIAKLDSNIKEQLKRYDEA